MNGRFGKDKQLGKCTFRGQSLIDYTICSINVIKLMKDFEVGDSNFLLSDGHSLLKWSICTRLENKNEEISKPCKTYKKWDSRHIEDFLSNISPNSVYDIFYKLQPNKPCINEVVNKIACLFTNVAKTSFTVQAQKPYPPNHKPWFGPQCHQARKNYHMVPNRYRNDHNRT